MSDTKFAHAATLDRFVDVVKGVEGVHLRNLPPFTTLLVRTMNSLYRVVIAEGLEVYVQGARICRSDVGVPRCATAPGAASESAGLGSA